MAAEKGSQSQQLILVSDRLRRMTIEDRFIEEFQDNLSQIGLMVQLEEANIVPQLKNPNPHDINTEREMYNLWWYGNLEALTQNGITLNERKKATRQIFAGTILALHYPNEIFPKIDQKEINKFDLNKLIQKNHYLSPAYLNTLFTSMLEKLDLISPLEETGILRVVNPPNPFDPELDEEQHDKWWDEHPKEGDKFNLDIEEHNTALKRLFVGGVLGSTRGIESIVSHQLLPRPPRRFGFVLPGLPLPSEDDTKEEDSGFRLRKLPPMIK